MTDLDPCPFCGEHAIFMSAGLPEYRTYTVSCDGKVQCLGQHREHYGFTATYYSKEEAAAAWNTRIRKESE